jgi:type 2 lantibiotic biosynthesis protein LanM
VLNSSFNIQAVVARASTLKERVDGEVVRAGEGSTSDSSKIAERIRRWRDLSADGEAGAFALHLRSLGLRIEDLPGILGSVQAPEHAPLPTWAVILQEIAAFGANEAGIQEHSGKRPTFLRTDDPLPFEDLYISIILFARQKLCRQAGKALYRQLAEEAHADWERYLLKRLADAGAKAAHLQFQTFKIVAHFGFSAAAGASPNESNGLYRAFVGRPSTLRLFALFEEYPVLARLCATLAMDWIASVAEVLKRLKEDQTGLRRRFCSGRKLGLVTSLQPGLSDPHHHGRSVLALKFAVGITILYKPRSLAVEKDFFGLLRWLAASGLRWPPRAVKIWDKGRYGWMQWVAHDGCENGAAAKRYYWRMGALLGLVHLLRAVDCHCQNIIAAGEHPTLIDLETLWHLQDANDASSPSSEDNRLSRYSILRTGFFSGGSIASGAAYEWGILDRDIHELGAKRLIWKEVNQDAMHFAFERRPMNMENGTPSLGGRVLHAEAYGQQIKAGFRCLGRCALLGSARRQAFCRQVKRLEQCQRRRICRSSFAYFLLLDRTLHPACLKEGVDRSIEWEVLKTDSRISQEDRDVEVTSLERLDIPRLNQPSINQKPLTTPGRLVPALGVYLEQMSFIEDRMPRRPQPP